MRDPSVAYREVRRQTEQAAYVARPWIAWWGRVGYAAHGVVYGLMVILALQAALGIGGDITDSEGVLLRIIAAPFGRVLLGSIAVGLVGYATWRFIQAGFDTEHKGTDLQGLLARGTYGVSGVIHLGVALFAVGLLRGTAPESGGGDQTAADRTAWLLTWPFGPWLVALVGAVVIGAGLVQLYKAYRADFHDELDLSAMSRTERLWAVRAGRLGCVARGIVFGVVGGFLIVAAIQADPGQARGIGGALATLAQEPAGPWLLGVVALGLMAFGCFELVEARFGRIVVS